MQGKITFYLDPTVQQFGLLNFTLEVEGQAWFWGELQTQSTPGKSILECSGLEGRTHITLTVEGVFYILFSEYFFRCPNVFTDSLEFWALSANSTTSILPQPQPTCARLQSDGYTWH